MDGRMDGWMDGWILRHTRLGSAPVLEVDAASCVHAADIRIDLWIYTLHGYLDISCIYGGMLLKDISYTYMEIVIYIYIIHI